MAQILFGKMSHNILWNIVRDLFSWNDFRVDARKQQRESQAKDQKDFSHFVESFNSDVFCSRFTIGLDWLQVTLNLYIDVLVPRLWVKEHLTDRQLANLMFVW